MKDDNVMNFWILTVDGAPIFHLSKSKEHVISPELLNCFFTGLLQFVVDFSGSGFYHLFVENSIFIGIQSGGVEKIPFYLILQIKDGSKRNITKIRKELEKVGQNIEKLPNLIALDPVDQEKLIINTLSKNILFKSIK